MVHLGESELYQGAEAWNQYRRSSPQSKIELWDVDMSESDFHGVNLSHATLHLFRAFHTNLSGSDFSEADLSHADLRGADLSEANLSGANLWGANLSGANLCRADLREAKLRKAILNDGIHGEAHFWGANTQGCLGCPEEPSAEG